MGKYKRFYLREKAKASVKSEERLRSIELKQKERLRSIELKQKERLRSIELKQKERLESKKLKAFTQTRKQRIKELGTIKIAPYLSQEQEFLGSMFGGGDRVLFMNPESESMPKLNGALMRNKFADELDLDSDQTASTFGFGIIKQKSGLF